MNEWLQERLGISVDEAELLTALAVLAVTLLSLALPPVRRLVTRVYEHALLWSGQPNAKYRRWFLQEHGTLRNIYLNRVEELDLTETYVPLSVFSEVGSNDTRVVATQVMSPSGPRRVLLLGDPGTGKTTLLKAYGAGVMRSSNRVRSSDTNLDRISKTSEIPVLLTLRQIAKTIEAGTTLEGCVLCVLAERAGIRAPERFLRMLLRQGRLVLLLDGLDELARGSYSAVREAIYDFATKSEESYLPTSLSRIIISCRKQNFFQFQDDWIESFSERYYTIAPLRDDEIATFIRKRRSNFTEERTPGLLRSEIYASGTLELHRNPLILTISIGLYTQLTAYEIPSALDQFYNEMIKELLRRHDFRADDKRRMNRFRADDKYRFLRHLAFDLASRSAPFDDFRYLEVVNSCKKMLPSIARLQSDDVVEFVNEIIDRSGLLTKTSEDGLYAFAHRAFHEHLAASQLAFNAAHGGPYLLERALDPEWRQVIVFFCGLDTPAMPGFMVDLASSNLELAIQCLSAAATPTRVAKLLFRKLHEKLKEVPEESEAALVLLAALVRATYSPVEGTRLIAFKVLSDRLVRISRWPDTELKRRVFLTLFGGEFPAATKLLQLMSRESSAPLARAIVDIARAAPASPGVVSALWRCLSIPDFAHSDIARDIVKQLLILVMDRENFDELERLPRLFLDWVPQSHKRAAYPLRTGLPQSSNLVTLLGCAFTLKVIGELPTRNAYFEALEGPGHPLLFLDRGLSRLNRSRLPLVIRNASYAVLALCVGASIAAISVLLESERITDPEVHWTLLGVHCTVVALVVSVTWGAFNRYERHAYYGPFSWTAFLLPVGDDGPAAFRVPQMLRIHRLLMRPRPHNLLSGVFFLSFALFLSVAFLPVTVSYALPVATFLPYPPIVKAAIAVVGIILFFWLPATEACGAYSPFFRDASGLALSVYADPRSRHWVGTPTVSRRARRVAGPAI